MMALNNGDEASTAIDQIRDIKQNSNAGEKKLGYVTLVFPVYHKEDNKDNKIYSTYWSLH
jgi:hypothetical protein